ncbi:phytoene/squalene synthase family protein [Polynucleobacter arcticus]|uniref:Phytoene/squalene synthase family protein n=1 Tax=Polynucleobacter arcticus TaxID=1743165 RepID=A0A6M9PT43_9BURK|nr:phytoene/squalene synthase family protein [Polynucleobacter arcticus]
MNKVGTQTNFSSAESVLANKGRSFHWARRLLGKIHSERATRLYRLCRYIDDLGDEENSVVVSRQKLLEARNAFNLEHSDNEVLNDGLSLLNECQIDKSIVLDLIAGVDSDTQLVRIEDQDALLRYCYQVAGTVGLMMSKALDTHDEAAYPFAIDLGIAMQITNICRDVKVDALANRRYIPANLVQDFEPIALIDPNEQQKKLIQSAVANLLDCAEKYYASGEKGLPYLPLEARLSILVAARVYREIGRELKNQNYEYWHRRIVVSTPRKIVITVQALASSLLSPNFWRRPKQHDAHLHRALLSQSSS